MLIENFLAAILHFLLPLLIDLVFCSQGFTVTIMGSLCSCLCAKPDEDSPGDRAFDAGDEEYREYKGIDASQRNSPDTQALLKNAIKSYNSAIDYYRKTEDLNLGAALLNLATVKWDMYRSADETTVSEEKAGTRAANLLEEVIKLDNEALSLWQARESPPPPYPTLLGNLARAFRERFMINKQSSDVQRAIELYKDILDFTQKTTKTHVEAVMEIGITYWTWYRDPSSTAPRQDEQLQNAIQHLMDANGLCQNGYPDIQCTCLYTLAWINHHRFEKQEELRRPNPTSAFLNDAIHFYQSTLNPEIGMPHNDPRYAKSLWFIPMLLFHRYERDKQDYDLQEAQTRAQNALNFPGITDEEYRIQLTAVRDFDSKINSAATRSIRKALRRSTKATFRSSESDEYSGMRSPTDPMTPVPEIDAGGSPSAGADGQEKHRDQLVLPGVGVLTSEPPSDS